jgi:hypothetical protein
MGRKLAGLFGIVAAALAFGLGAAHEAGHSQGWQSVQHLRADVQDPTVITTQDVQDPTSVTYADVQDPTSVTYADVQDPTVVTVQDVQDPTSLAV